MFFSTAAALAALAFSRIALGSPVPESDPHEADLRSFGVSGCYDENQGVYTLLQSDNNVCKQFVDSIGSMTLTDSLCTVTLYADDACSESPVVAPVGICQNGSWQSFKLTC